MNTELINQIKQDKGLRLFPYRCPAGKLTIGFGRNLEDRGISGLEAEALLQADIVTVKHALEKRLGEVYKTLDASRQSVLIQMGFQLGIEGMLAFKKMIQALKAKDYETASAEMLDSKWAKQTPGRAKRLAGQMEMGK